jgi:predicted nucleic acid-binding protein
MATIPQKELRNHVGEVLRRAEADALPFDAVVARECGWLHALFAQRGGAPRRRAMDLAIAATANVHGVPLLTYNTRTSRSSPTRSTSAKPETPG